MAVGALLRSAFTVRRLRSSLLMGVVVCLAAAGIATSLIVRAEAGERVDAAFAAADAADLVLQVAPGAEGRLRLDDDPDVARVGPPVAALAGELHDTSDREEIDLRELQPAGTLNAPVVRDGRRPSAPGEVLLDAALADDRGVDIGNTIDIGVDGAVHPLRVVGLGFDFTDCFYPACDPAHVWVDPEAFESLRGAAQTALMVPVDLVDPATARAVVDRARRQIGDDLLDWTDWRIDTRGDMLVETDFFGAFLAAFGLFVLISCAIVIVGTISARTVALRRTIGLQKAIGFTPRQLSAAVLLEHLAIASAACIAGGAIATGMAPMLRVGSLRILEGSGAELHVQPLLVSGCIVCAIVAAATLAPAWRAGRTEATAAIAEVPPRRPLRRPARRSRMSSRSGVPMPVWLAATTLTSRPLRSVLNVCAVAIAIVAAIVSVSIVRSIDVVVLDPANAGDPADASMALPDGLDPARVERALAELPEVAAWFSYADDRATIGEHDVHVRAIGGDPATNGFVVGGGRRIERVGEATAGFGLMRQLGWQIGERVDVRLDDEVVQVQIVGWYRETEDSGRILQIRMEDYARVVPDVVPSYGVIGTDEQNPVSVVASLASAFGPRVRIEPNDAGGTDLTPFKAALAAMTSMIAAVALAHLVTSVITTSRERARRFAIQRAIGFDGRRLIAEAISHGLLVASLAALIGVPAGWYAQGAIGDLITRQVGAGPGLSIGPSAAQLALIVGAALALVAGVTMLATRPTLRERNA